MTITTSATGGIVTRTYDTNDLGLLSLKTVSGTINYGSTVTLPVGTVLGKVTGTNKWKPCISTATDGSQYPRGILYGINGLDVTSGVDKNAPSIIVGCECNQNMISFINGTDTLATQIAMPVTGGGGGTVNFTTMGAALLSSGIIVRDVTSPFYTT